MAVDKKSDHYTSAKNYTDLDGMSRSFTFIDHDIKPKISLFMNDYNKDWEKEYRDELVDRILSSHPTLAPEPFQNFIQRGELGITWREEMIKDQGNPIWTLRDLAVLLENRSGLNTHW